MKCLYALFCLHSVLIRNGLTLTTLTFHRSIKFFAWLKIWSYRRNLLYVSINQTIPELKSDETANKAASTQLHRRDEIVCAKDVSKRWFILTYYIVPMSKGGITMFRSHHIFSTKLMAQLLTHNNCDRPKLPKVGEMPCRNGNPLGFLCCDGEWEILWVFHKCCTSCRCWSVCTGYTSFAKSMWGSNERSWTAQSTLQAVYAYWIVNTVQMQSIRILMHLIIHIRIAYTAKLAATIESWAASNAYTFPGAAKRSRP